MEIDHVKEQCKHDRCTCEVEAGHPYCSEYCRNADEFSEDIAGDEEERIGACGCGHAECKPR